MYNNNWFKWYYDSYLYSNKRSFNSQLEIEIDHSPVQAQSLKEEFILSVKQVESSIRNVLLTGNIFNYVTIKCFLDLQIPVKAFIPRYGSLNLKNFLTAVDFCHLNRVPFEVVDLNVPLFYKNKARDLYSKSYPIDLNKLPVIEVIEMIGQNLICCLRDPIIVRDSVFYDCQGTWKLKITEDDICIPAYFSKEKNLNLDFFFSRKELVKSYIETNEVKNLIQDNIQEFSSSMLIKDDVVKKIWPELSSYILDYEEQLDDQEFIQYAGKLWAHHVPKLFDLNQI